MRTLISFLFLLLTSFTLYAQCPLDLHETPPAPSEDLLLYLPFDFNTDNLGTGNFTASISGASFTDSDWNGGLLFDGQDDYLELTPSLDLKDDLTIAAWITPYDQTDGMSILSIRNQCPDSFRGWAMAQFNIGIHQRPGLNYHVNTTLNCDNGSRGDRYNTDPLYTLPDHHASFVAVTVKNNRSEQREITLYINCAEVSITMPDDWGTGAVFDSVTNFITTIGAASNVNGQHRSFNGVIDELRVYTRALDAAGLSDIYRSYTALQLDTNAGSACPGDSSVFTLYHPQPGVMYEIIDVQTGQVLSLSGQGNCDSVLLLIAPVSDTASVQIVATHLLSGCSTILDSLIRVPPAIFPDLTLGQDTVLCEGATLLLDVTTPNATYAWQDNSNSPTLTVSRSGEYAVTVTTDCDQLEDRVRVTVENCCKMYVPNVFSPNRDGINDEFGALISFADCQQISAFSMDIFDRWGQLVFHSSDPNFGWDGTVGTEISNEGLYVWVIQYQEGMRLRVQSSDVLLVR